MARSNKPSKRRKIVGWTCFALLIGAAVFCLCEPWAVIGLMIRAAAQVNDTAYVSPDGDYTAIVRAVDTGAVGSSSGVLLRRGGLFSKETTLAVGGWEFFDRAKWTAPRVLTVGCGSTVPDPSWVRRWRDVEIVYVPD